MTEPDRDDGQDNETCIKELECRCDRCLGMRAYFDNVRVSSWKNEM